MAWVRESTPMEMVAKPAMTYNTAWARPAFMGHLGASRTLDTGQGVQVVICGGGFCLFRLFVLVLGLSLRQLGLRLEAIPSKGRKQSLDI